MSKVKIDLPAPDFKLADYQGRKVTLSEFKGDKCVLLVFNRGFTWPFCRRHMAQLRQNYDRLAANDVQVLVVGPEDAQAFKDYFEQHNLPFIGLPDPQHNVLKLYGQEIKIFKLGRMPAQALIDKEGIVRFVHYGKQMNDIPEPEEILQELPSFTEATVQ